MPLIYHLPARCRAVHSHARLPHPAYSRHHLPQDSAGGGPLEAPCGRHDPRAPGGVPTEQRGRRARTGPRRTTTTAAQPADTQELRDHRGNIYYLLPSLHPPGPGHGHGPLLLPAAAHSHECAHRSHTAGGPEQHGQPIRVRRAL